MSIRIKLTLAFLCMAILFGLFGIYVYRFNQTIAQELVLLDEAFEETTTHTIPELDNVASLRLIIEQSKSSLHEFIVGEIEAKDDFETSIDAFDEHLEALNLLLLGESNSDHSDTEGAAQIDDGDHQTEIAASLELIEETHSRLHDSGIQLIEVIEVSKQANQVDSLVSAEALVLLDVIDSVITELTLILEELGADAEKEVIETQQATDVALHFVKDLNSEIRLLTMIASIAGFLLAIGVGFFMARSIANPITTLKNAAVQIGQGNFETRIDITSRDEVGVLAEVVNKMAGDLSKAFGSMASRTATIIENLVDGLLVTDNDGTITLTNPALESIFALDGRDLVGQAHRDVFDEKLTDLITLSLNSPNEAFSAELELPGDRSGKALATAILDNTVSPDSSTPAVLGSVVIIRDATAEKEVDRMKTDFISMVSHELRTPLTSVLGFTKIIKKRMETVILPILNLEEKKIQRAANQIGKNVDIIISEGERLTALINDVLDIAKMEAGKTDWNMAPLVVSDQVLERAIMATSALFEGKPVKLVKDFEANLPKVEGDADRLIQVVINLISNAVKFTDEGTVTCRTRRVNGEIEVSIVDSGMGIAPNDVPKVFEKFKQVGDTMTDKPKGTGLGLPISMQIVAHHGGRIWATSELGQGSTFLFTLPVMLAPTDEGAASLSKTIDISTLVKQIEDHRDSPVKKLAAAGRKTILVVDDEPHIRELLRQELEARNYVVLEARDGVEAITMVKQERPDLITLDVMMPEITGFDVAAVLKNDPLTVSIPIIIVSIIEDQARGLQLGVDRYLTKPIDTEKLLADVEQLLSRGSSHKKVLVVDEDVSAVKTMSDIFQAQGYHVSEAANGLELMEKAMSIKPDMIIVNSTLSEHHLDMVRGLRFEKDMENVLLFFFQENQDQE